MGVKSTLVQCCGLCVVSVLGMILRGVGVVVTVVVVVIIVIVLV